ncbi:CHAP domain-containing protein [Furfurilactobacillus rossiae]|uniref:Dextransucrase n=1 Tax=Furfurilactobacillus rossiae DSM 15814 TaxID=1114972 RepID=A0A0R1R847_9LACO|nr:CHAP domain-containing protein [Furfurilactobacillus rossiae]KRL52940.1 dextransucrase [Furfurilactobacillus rossiae DSM 15814]QFR67992.1 CHAP domain-containing protein [Furfurilactobacillus rossiae]QLE60984.1 Choline binding protein A [Furfurilactobacillus rossiae]
MNQSVRFKLYKSGKIWVTAGIVTVGIIFGSVNVSASVNGEGVPSSTKALQTTQTISAVGPNDQQQNIISNSVKSAATTESSNQQESSVQPTSVGASATSIANTQAVSESKPSDTNSESIIISSASAATSIASIANKQSVTESSQSKNVSVATQAVSAGSATSAIANKGNIAEPNQTINDSTFASSASPKSVMAAQNLDFLASTQDDKFYINGQPANGYQQDGDNWYMFKDGIKQSQIQPWANGYYYFDPVTYLRTDNAFRSEWGGIYYFGSDGRAVQGLQTIDGKKYYFGDDNTYDARKNAFVTLNDKTYYFGDNGARIDGWISKDGQRYYGDGDNGILKGYSNGDGWRMFDVKDGHLITNSIYPWANGYYYLDGNGMTVSNSFENQWGGTYYFGSDGRAVQGIQKIDGAYYFFGSDNTYNMKTNSWVSYWNNTYYAGADGKLLSGLQKIDGTFYFFDKTGFQMHKDSYDMGYPNCWYMFGPDGKIVTGLYQYMGSWYYFDPTSYLKVTNTDMSINGVQWHFDGNGIGTKKADRYFVSYDTAKNGGINGFWNNEPTYIPGQCTSFVAGALAASGVPQSEWTHLGNGAEWAGNARAKGLRVDMTPSVGAVISYKGANWNSGYGHVVYITGLNANGSVHIIEGNYSGLAFHERDVWIDNSIAGIIHF